jgi:hypothetical protein
METIQPRKRFYLMKSKKTFSGGSEIPSNLPTYHSSLEDWIKYVNETSYQDNFKKDCSNYELLPTILPATKRIISMGDIHGDLELAIRSFKLAGLIKVDKKSDKDIDISWNKEAKDTIVVQIGDQIDRCRPYLHKCENKDATYQDEAHDVKILKMFNDLDKQARKYNSRVISLLGNHEIMNAEGNTAYVSYLGLKDFENYKDPKNENLKFESGKEARIHAFKPGNELATLLACTRMSAVIVGSWMFVHAAILPALLEKFQASKEQDLTSTRKNLESVNTLVRKWLLAQINPQNMRKILSSDKISPFWPRVLGNIPPNVSKEDPRCAEYLNPVLKVFQIDGMIIGHTPQYYAHKDGVNATCDNSLWRVDIGLSKAFYPFDNLANPNDPIHKENKHTAREVQILEILDDKKVKVLSE